MSSYCTITDVQNLIKTFTITDTTNVTTTEVTNDIIPEISNKIDEALAKYYVTPVTGTNALATLQRIARRYAAAEVMDRLYLGQAPSASQQATEWCAQADAELAKVINGEIILFDAQPTGDTPEPISQKISDNLSGPDYPTPPAFDMGMKF